MNLESMKVVVTGGASGMGRDFCLSLVRSGASVAACDMNEDGLASLVEEASDAICNRARAHAVRGPAMRPRAPSLLAVSVLHSILRPPGERAPLMCVCSRRVRSWPASSR